MTRRAIAGLLVLSLVTACGGGLSTPNGPQLGSPGGPSSPPTHLVNVKVSIAIPMTQRTGGVRPGYVSPNTRSLVIQLASVDGQGVTGVNATTIETAPNSHGCKAQSGGTVCTGATSGSPGDDVFSVTTYAGAAATGAVLSVGTVQARIAKGGGGVSISNRLSLTLNGVIASLHLRLSPNASKRGKPATASVDLTAFDASGAQIVGPSDYATPVALTIQGDVQGAFTLHARGKSGASLSIIKPTSPISLNYDGNVQASSVTIAASVSGLGSIGANSPFVLHGRMPPPPVGTIYALNVGSGGGRSALVTEYSGKAEGNAAPERTLSLSSKLFAQTIAVDSNGNLYVGYLDNSLGYSPQTGLPDTGNEIAIYAPGASGNAQPKAVLTADSNTSTALFPVFINFDASGRLVTYGATTVDGNTGDAVLTYAAGSSGPAAPQYGLDFASPGLHYAGPTGLAIDASNNFYINGALHSILGNQYGLYVALASDIGNPHAAPARTIPWDSTTKLEPGFTTNVGLDPSGEILIGTWTKVGSGSNAACQAGVNVYAAGLGGGSTYLRILTLGDVATHGNACYSSRNPLLSYFPEIQLYGTLLFVADDFNDALSEFAASGHGLVKPALRIVGSATQLNAPIALAITSISGPAKAGPVTGSPRLSVGAPHLSLNALNAR